MSGMIGAAAVALPGVLASAPGWAQAIEEMVVTTRRKEESLQEVPISVSAISSEEITRLGITNAKGVAKYTPGIELDEGFGAQDTRVVIRGLSPTRGRSNVAILVDGIDFTGEAVSTAGGGLIVSQRLVDAERIEVVKGPQSALYGRSAFAGAIQYISKSPSLEEWESDVFFDVGRDSVDNQNFNLSAGFGGPITDTFGLRINGVGYEEDGYYVNQLTGESVGGSEGAGIALTGLWQPNDAWMVKGRVAYSADDYEPQAQARVDSNTVVDLNDSEAVQNGSFGNLIGTNGLAQSIALFSPDAYPDCGTTATPDSDYLFSCLGTPKALVTGRMPDADELSVRRANNPRRPRQNYTGTDVDTLTGTLTVDFDSSVGVFSSYTGYGRLESQQFFDAQVDPLTQGTYQSLDGTYSFTIDDAYCAGALNCAPAVQEIDFDNRTELFSQELRYATNFEGPLNFTVGALYWNEDVDQDESSLTISNSIWRAPGLFNLTTFDQTQPAGPLLPSVVYGNDIAGRPRNTVGRETTSWSAYGLIEWDISEAWSLALEGRFVDEEIIVFGPQCDVAATEAISGLANCSPQTLRGGSSVVSAGPGGTLPQGTLFTAVTTSASAKSTDSFFAPKATLEWKPTDEQLWYGSISKGVKPGGIATITAGTFFMPEDNRFDSEELIAYELGGKTTWLDGALVLNGAVFYQDYTDKQVGVTRFNELSQTDVGGIENAGEAEIYGVELEATWQVSERFLLSGGYTWLDAEYTNFESLTSSSNEIARAIVSGNGGCLEVIDQNPDPAEFAYSCRIDRSGNDIEDIPEHSFVGFAQYVAPIGGQDFEWFADASFIYTSERWIDENNVKELDAYWVTDLRLGLQQEEGNWEIILYLDNAFDDDTVKSAVDFGSQVNTVRQGQFPPGPTDGVVVSMPDPRVIGIRSRFRF
jgi:outer membrane receptor protein involved in Fe transport